MAVKKDPSRDNPKTVLIVEDSTVQALALESVLEDAGLKTLRAENGRVGVEMAKKYLPHAIVLDVMMPEMDGISALKELKADPATAEIPTVLFSSREEKEVVQSGFEIGAVDFIPKDGFSSAVLLGTLRQLNIIES